MEIRVTEAHRIYLIIGDNFDFASTKDHPIILSYLHYLEDHIIDEIQDPDTKYITRIYHRKDFPA